MGGESERRSGEHGPGVALKDISDQLQPKSEDEGPYEEVFSFEPNVWLLLSLQQPRYSKIDDKRPKHDHPADSTMSDVVETMKTSNHHPKVSLQVICSSS
jgi:hypothetical protein